MAKCAKCSKVINKKSPGLQCGKCVKWFHATCGSLSIEQLTSLSSTDSVDWQCNTCRGGAKSRRLSYILPDEEDDDSTEAIPLSATTMTQQMLHQIKVEVQNIIKTELQRTLQFYSDKIDDYECKLQNYEKQLKLLDNQCYDLKNNVKNINLKYSVLENKLNTMEQQQLSNQLEICGIKEKENEKTEELVKNVAIKIEQNPEDIVKVYRKRKRLPTTTKRNELPSSIIVVLREGTRDLWLDAAKKTTILPAYIGGQGDSKVYLRESITPATAHLLWKTKEMLRGEYSFIWCKRGSVLIRKQEKDKVITIRSLQELESIKNPTVNVSKPYFQPQNN